LLVTLSLATTNPAMYLDSTRAQLERYVTWWCTEAFSQEPGPVRTAISELAQQLMEIVDSRARA
jgi:hypothetical protein